MKKGILYALIVWLCFMPQAFAQGQTRSEIAWQSFYEQFSQESNSDDWAQVSLKLEHIVELSQNEISQNSWHMLKYLAWLAISYDRQDRALEALGIRLKIRPILKSLPADMIQTPKYKTYADGFMYQLGKNYMTVGDYSAAEPLLLKELSRLQNKNPINEAALFSTRAALIRLYSEWGNHSEAEKYAQFNLKWSQLPTGEAMHLIDGLYGLAITYRNQARYSEAEPLFLQALALSKAKLESEREFHRTTIPFAGLLIKLNRLDEASELLKTALASRIKNDTLFRVANVQLYIADIALLKGDLNGAQDNYNKALEAYKITVGLNRQYAAQAYYGLGEIARMKGDISQAKQFYSDALRIQKRFLLKNHSDTAKTLLALSTL